MPGLGIGLGFGAGLRPVPRVTLPSATLSMPTLQSKRAAGQRAVLALIGDSTTAGWGSGVATGLGNGSAPGTSGNFRVDKSWPSQVAALLNAAGVQTRADALFPHIDGAETSQAYLTDSNPTLALSGSWVGNTSHASIGGYLFFTDGAGNLVYTPQYAANRFEVFVTGAGGLGTLTVSDASGTLATIDETITNDGVQQGGFAFRKVTVARSAASTSPITVARTSGGNCFLAGIIPYDTTSPRLEIINLGIPGVSSAGLTDSAFPWRPFPGIKAVVADAWMVGVGLNDSIQNRTSSEFQSSLDTYVGQLVSAGGDIALIKETTATTGHNMSAAYLTAIDSITSARSLRPVLNFNAISLVTADRYDGVHLSEAGYAKAAQAAKTYLIGA